MAQQPVELILFKQLASYLALPIMLVGPDGRLLYFNHPAEELLGHRYAEIGSLSLSEWVDRFAPTDCEGGRLAPEVVAPSIALRERRPADDRVCVDGRDGRTRRLAMTAFPLQGQGADDLGVVTLLWEPDET